jgi:hypothetical protein
VTLASALAVEVSGLTKVFEKGRRTIWQRIRREADKREQVVARPLLDPALEYVALLLTTAVAYPIGLWAYRRADRRIRRLGTINQY